MKVVYQTPTKSYTSFSHLWRLLPCLHRVEIKGLKLFCFFVLCSYKPNPLHPQDKMTKQMCNARLNTKLACLLPTLIRGRKIKAEKIE